MKILFILPQIPYPPHSGGRIVTWNTLKRFAKTCSVSLVCLYHHPSELEALETVKDYCEEATAFPAYGKWAFKPLVQSLFSRWPYKARRFYNPDMFAYIQRLLKRESFDVIHAQNFYTTSYVTGAESALKIHYKENVEGNILTRYARASKNPLIKTAAYVEGWRTRRFELRACRKFDRILCISPIDRDTIAALDPSLTIHHQKPGVDLEAYPFLEEPSGPPTIVFTGMMSYYPNSDGMLYFLQQIWPVIKKRTPDARLQIVGAGPPESIQHYHGNNDVAVTGRVESVREYLLGAHVFIVPLRIGGGIRLKILEAMASGRAIVSTSIGCEGLEGKHGEQLAIADDPEAFANAVVNLIENPAERNRLRENARSLVESVYDWDTVISRQVADYQMFVEKAVSPARRQDS